MSVSSVHPRSPLIVPGKPVCPPHLVHNETPQSNLIDPQNGLVNSVELESTSCSLLTNMNRTVRKVSSRTTSTEWFVGPAERFLEFHGTLLSQLASSFAPTVKSADGSQISREVVFGCPPPQVS
ncbi:hypothetical protein ASPCAL14817 [Aspergillus calidoustus]|uniref:Uncharacterized protein n=1 Tax=Aspergillus calidoustus TaxID=454130 RepID=A0A0U5GJX9_ASPCI|nr:hypothetical protein ASPCAL14817 [Aspergillus calidoustus]